MCGALLRTGRRGIDVYSTIERMTSSHTSTTESSQFLPGGPGVANKPEYLPAVPASSTSLATAPARIAPSSIALVISCSDYSRCCSSARPLPAVDNAKFDADEIYLVLLESGVDIVKRSDNISRSQVVAEFVDLLQEVMGTDASAIYLFYAGHHDAIDQTCYCGAPLTNFPLQDLVQVLQKVHTWERPITNARAVIMLDCCACWSDCLTPWPDCCNQRAGQASIMLLAAGEHAMESAGHGFFTEALLTHLTRGPLSLPELSSRIWSSVCSGTRYSRYIQRPFGLWRGDISGSSVLPGRRLCRADLPLSCICLMCMHGDSACIYRALRATRRCSGFETLQ